MGLSSRTTDETLSWRGREWSWMMANKLGPALL